MPKFSLDRIVHEKREVVFDIFSNFDNYQKLLPQHYPSVRVRSKRENSSVVEEHILFGNVELVVMAKHVTDKPLLHEIFVIGGDSKGTHIKQQFLDHVDGTKILVDVDLKLKGMMKISGLFGKTKFYDDYAKIIDDFVKITEN